MSLGSPTSIPGGRTGQTTRRLCPMVRKSPWPRQVRKGLARPLQDDPPLFISPGHLLIIVRGLEWDELR